MAKRRRRKRVELQRIQRGLARAILKEGAASVSQLISNNGSKLGLKSTPNDKNLVKRLLNAVEGVEMEKRGRELYFVSQVEAPPPPNRLPNRLPSPWQRPALSLRPRRKPPRRLRQLPSPNLNPNPNLSPSLNPNLSLSPQRRRPSPRRLLRLRVRVPRSRPCAPTPGNWKNSPMR